MLSDRLLAIKDLAQHLGVEPDLVTVIETQSVTWPDASLGCPQPEILHAQVQTQGYLIILEANEQKYEYHTDSDQQIIYCKGNNLPTFPITPVEPVPLMPIAPHGKSPKR